MKTIDKCARCGRETSLGSSDYLEWEALGPDGDGTVCPDCITAAEQAAMDEDVMAMAEKVQENRIRRMAQRQGLALRKSRRRDPYALDYGSYWLVNPDGNYLVAGDQWGWDLDEIEEFLKRDAALDAPPR